MSLKYTPEKTTFLYYLSLLNVHIFTFHRSLFIVNNEDIISSFFELISSFGLENVMVANSSDSPSIRIKINKIYVNSKNKSVIELLLLLLKVLLLIVKCTKL